MVSVMRLLDEVSRGERDFGFVEPAMRTRSAAAVSRGIDIVLRAQIKVNGRLTAWCAQHDEVTLEPRKARTYEHPSLSGMETVGITRFLMERPDSREPRLATAIEAAVAWLKSAQLTGWRLEQRQTPGTPRGWDRVMVHDPKAAAAVGPLLRHPDQQGDLLGPRRHHQGAAGGHRIRAPHRLRMGRRLAARAGRGGIPSLSRGE